MAQSMTQAGTSKSGAHNPVLAWLQSEGLRYPETLPFVSAFAEKLLQAGVEVSRINTGVHILHPQIDASSCLWQSGKGVMERRFKMNHAVVRNSPMGAVYAGRSVRRRLDGAAEPGDFPIYADLRAEGTTDYLGLPLPFSDGSWMGVAYATKRAGGFPEEHVDFLQGLVPSLAVALEIQTHKRTTLTLLDTYVGRTAGRRVLDGVIKRGMCEPIEAVIWFCDLRGFTPLSETLAGPELVNYLNDYFGAMTDAVGGHGGEVLKFIGDALLAIFPLAGQEGASVAARAVQAAREASSAIEALNEIRRGESRPEIRFGLALHAGEVLYGNIGGEMRLDFTVIGQAVNVACRIESLTKDVGRQVLASADFAQLCSSGAVEPVGVFPLKGIGTGQGVYALRA